MSSLSAWISMHCASLGAALLVAGCGDADLGATPLRSTVSIRGTVTGTGAGGLRVREKPTTSSAVVATLEDGAEVVITCRARGETVEGNAFWDFLESQKGYVADAFIETRAGQTVPSCSISVPAPPPKSDAGTVDIEGPAVQPHVQFFANEACRVVDACRAATRAGHQPSADLALDFPISEAFGKLPTDDYAFGERLADFAISDMARYRIEYVIFRQRYNDGSGWQPMDDRGSITENHLDHVHVSFLP